MTDASTVRALGFILACYARVEGMKANNQQADPAGGGQYQEEAFYHEAAQMEIIARDLQG